MTAMAASHFLDGPSTQLVKIFAMASVAMIPIMYSNWSDEANFVHLMWSLQLVVHLPMTYLLAKAGGLF